jgi:hypothetical protein
MARPRGALVVRDVGRLRHLFVVAVAKAFGIAKKYSGQQIFLVIHGGISVGISGIFQEERRGR